MEIGDTSSWKLGVRHVDSNRLSEASSVWSETPATYEQTVFGQVTSAEFSPCGKYFGCTGSNHSLLLRLPATEGAAWNEQLPRKAFSIRFRGDSRMVAQCIDQRVRIRSTETAFERFFEGHTRDVRDSVFLSNQMLASCSDDASIRFWELTNDTELGISESHTDYVRTLDRVSENVVLSGSYDKSVAVWDVRVALSEPVMSFQSPKQVEKVIFIPNHNVAAAAAADVVSLFDLRSVSTKKRGALPAVHEMSLHSKTVTSLAYSRTHDTLITGGYDRRVKFVSMKPGAEFRVEAMQKFERPVTGLAVTDRMLAIGTSSGQITLHKVSEPDSAQPKRSKSDAEVISDRLQHIRKLFVRYQYHRALRVALFSRHADVIATTLEELHRRCALHVALSGHNDRSISQVVRFCVDRLDDPALHQICASTLDLVYAIYGTAASSSAFFHRELLRAHKRIGDMVGALEPIQRTTGMLEYVLE